VAAVAAASMIAQQVAGKATRDALFLSNIGVRGLPAMMAGSAVASLLVVLLISRMMWRHTPARVVPTGFGLSAAAMVGVWVIGFRAPRLAACALYVHTSLFGAAMISAFWSLINETFDAHASRRSVTAVAAGGTLGGLLGGVAAWRASAVIDVPTMLPFLAALNLVSMWGSLRLQDAVPKSPVHAASPAPSVASVSALRIVRERPYLRQLATIVALGAMTSGLLDYVFNAEAVKAFAKGPALLSFFALFWLAVGILSVASQLLLGRLALEKLGLVLTVALLPAVVALGGAVGLAVPGLWSSAILRGSEATQRSSLFRAAYEMLYTPLSERGERTSKTLIDVGFDRLGTVAAALITMVTVSFVARRTEATLLVIAIACALMSLTRSRPLHLGYLAALEEGLRKGAREACLAPASPREKVEVRDKIVQRLEVVMRRPESAAPRTVHEARQMANGALRGAADLTSRNAVRVRRVLLAEAPLTRPLVSFAILLLADAQFHSDAIHALRKTASKVTGQLVDALCDPDIDFDVRRRIPRVLSDCLTQQAADGLIRGTEDARFEVRYACGRALLKITGHDAGIVIALETVIAVVRREVTLSKKVWESQPAPQLDEEENDPPAFIDRLLRDRLDRSLEHIFTLLALHLDRESLRIAFKALHGQDHRLRGTALEYLETVLPNEVHDAVWPFLGEERPMRAPRPATEILADLVSSVARGQVGCGESKVEG
jgi:ATP:ADP antiporter, AAA family